jgi:hypothetical protein
LVLQYSLFSYLDVFSNLKVSFEYCFYMDAKKTWGETYRKQA